jgi:hypothetical protein
MNTVLLSAVSLLTGVSGAGQDYDVAFPWPVIAIGLVGILVIAAIIVLIIVFSVKFLKRIRAKSSDTPK